MYSTASSRGRLILGDAILQFHDEGHRAACRALDALKQPFDPLLTLLQLSVHRLLGGTTDLGVTRRGSW